MKKSLFLRNLLILIVLTVSANGFAQTVTGTVSDASGTLPGATVVVKGTSNGVTTDFDGRYELHNVPENAILHFSFVGYEDKEVPYTGQSEINVVLQESVSQLQEVVVVGYTTQTRGDITGSVASVNMDDALKVPVSNAAEALQGRVTGVNVTNAGAPGSPPKITIRGLGTSNNTNPLYIIDGVQTDDPNVLNSIDPSDIEQMNILKDGAASIYGARASNGVIIVTTKDGGYNMDKASFSFDIYSGFSKATNLPDLLNAQQHGEMVFQSLRNDGVTVTHPQYGDGPDPVVPDKLNLPDGFPSVTVKKPNGTYWPDEIMQTAPTTNINFTMQNGTESGKYFMSVGYFTRDGIMKYTGFQRATTRLNSEFKIKKFLTVGEHLNVSFSDQNRGTSQAIQFAYRMNPLIPTHDDNGNFAGTYAAAAQIGNSNNPLAELERAKDNYNKDFRVFGDIYGVFDIFEGLKFKTSLGVSALNNDSRSFTKLNPEHSEPLSTNTLYVGDMRGLDWNWANTLTYSHSFGNHNINVMAGTEAVKNFIEAKRISRTDYLFEDPDFYNLSNGGGIPNVEYHYIHESSLFSIFGSLNYNYAQKYFLTATVRSDKSSRFKGDNKTGTFPSFSAGWLVSGEDFYNEDAFVSRIKLKASWGQLGNQSLPAENPTVNISSLSEQYANYYINGSSLATGAKLDQVGNPNLKWETSESTNFGVDLGFLENKLYLSAEYFIIKTKDLITRDNSLISTTAIDATAPLVNLGSVENKGFDFSLGYHDQTESDFRYGFDFNLSQYNNKVTELISDFQSGASYFRGGAITRTEVGRPISSFYGRKVTGFDDNGRFTYEDINGDGEINDEDRTYIGSPHPDFTYGLNIDLGYKGFDFSAFFTGSQGNDIYNYEKIFQDFPTFFNGNRSTRVLDSWTPDNRDATLPALSQTITNSETNPNSYFVEDGSYFRMKNLQVGYTINKKTTEKFGLDMFRIYIQGTNLFTITKYNGVDPEIISYDNLTLGVDNQTYPLAQIYTLGLNIKF